MSGELIVEYNVFFCFFSWLDSSDHLIFLGIIGQRYKMLFDINREFLSKIYNKVKNTSFISEYFRYDFKKKNIM